MTVMNAPFHPCPYIETVSDSVLGDSWRHAMATVRRCLEFFATDPAFYAPRYLEAVRTVSEDEAEMDRRGIPYTLSLRDWRHDPFLVAAVACEAMGAF